MTAKSTTATVAVAVLLRAETSSGTLARTESLYVPDDGSVTGTATSARPPAPTRVAGAVTGVTPSPETVTTAFAAACRERSASRT